MRRFKNCLMIVALTVTPLGVTTSIAQTVSPSANVQTSMTQGEIRKVDKSAGKLTIKHGEIKNLDMPSMTMVFQVRDDAMLDQVKVGDKVEFEVIDESGKMVVTVLQPVK